MRHDPLTVFDVTMGIIVGGLLVALLVSFAAGCHNEAIADAEAEVNQEALEQIQQLKQGD